MTKKNWLLLIIAVALAAVYVIYFTEWFKPKTVKIFDTSRNLRGRFQTGGGMPSMIFGLNRQLKLTEIKVVPLATWETNNKVVPIWHLISASNSIPLKMFFYGQHIGGLKPAVPGARPESLTTNTVYRLFVTAGKVTGQHDFELK
jgi:hypothetical protein